MSATIEKSRSRKKSPALSVSGHNVKPRNIKITKKIAEQIRNMPTEGWIIVMPSQGKWKVRKYGAERASGVYNELATAIEAAKKIGRALSNACIFVQDRNADTVQTIRE